MPKTWVKRPMLITPVKLIFIFLNWLSWIYSSIATSGAEGRKDSLRCWVTFHVKKITLSTVPQLLLIYIYIRHSTRHALHSSGIIYHMVSKFSSLTWYMTTMIQEKKRVDIQRQRPLGAMCYGSWGPQWRDMKEKKNRKKTTTLLVIIFTFF